MSCRLEDAITPEEREALRRLVAVGEGFTVSLPETHGVVLLSTRDFRERPATYNPPVTTGRMQ